MSDAAAANPGMSGAYLVRSMRLLIIEDDRDAAEYLVKAFREVGHVADHAADGEEGRGLALDGGYDVLIIDPLLPTLTGLAVIVPLPPYANTTPNHTLSATASVH